MTFSLTTVETGAGLVKELTAGRTPSPSPIAKVDTYRRENPMTRRCLQYFSVLLCLLLPIQGWAAITEVGGGSQRASGTFSGTGAKTVAFPGNVASGSLIVVAGTVYSNSGGAPSISVTDNRSPSFVVTTTVIDGQDDNFIACGFTTSSGANTISVTNSVGDASNTMWYSIDEFSGADKASCPEVDGSISTANSTTASDSLTTLNANALVVGVMTTDSPDTSFTPGGGWTQIAEQESHAVQSGSAIFQIVGAAGSYSPSWTLDASRIWYVSSASFKAAADETFGFRMRRIQ